MKDPGQVSEALYELATALKRHELKLRESFEAANECYESLMTEMEGDFAEEIYSTWKKHIGWADVHLKTIGDIELKIREQAEQLASI